MDSLVLNSAAIWELPLDAPCDGMLAVYLWLLRGDWILGGWPDGYASHNSER